jgi:hypothetical protein
VLVAGNPAAVVQELPGPGHLADPSIHVGGLRGYAPGCPCGCSAVP